MQWGGWTHKCFWVKLEGTEAQDFLLIPSSLSPFMLVKVELQVVVQPARPTSHPFFPLAPQEHARLINWPASPTAPHMCTLQKKTQDLHFTKA